MLTQNGKWNLHLLATLIVVVIVAIAVVGWSIMLGGTLGSKDAGWRVAVALLAIGGVLLWQFKPTGTPTLTTLAMATPTPVPVKQKRAYRRKAAPTAAPPTPVIDKSFFDTVKAMNISQARKARAENLAALKADPDNADLKSRKVAITARLRDLGDGGNRKKADTAPAAPKAKVGRPRKAKA